jgi:D-aminopeptidase
MALDGQPEETVQYTVAALAQINYGAIWDLHIGRVPVGKLMMDEKKRADWEKGISNRDAGPPKDGSIIVVIATDAPLHATQLRRVAKRATTGMARVGGWGSNSSGDLFLAFSTAEKIPTHPTDGRFDMAVRQKASLALDDTINAVFEAAADCTEESIYNGLCMAEDTEGPKGLKMNAIDLDRLKQLLEQHYVE